MKALQFDLHGAYVMFEPAGIACEESVRGCLNILQTLENLTCRCHKNDKPVMESAVPHQHHYGGLDKISLLLAGINFYTLGVKSITGIAHVVAK